MLVEDHRAFLGHKEPCLHLASLSLPLACGHNLSRAAPAWGARRAESRTRLERDAAAGASEVPLAELAPAHPRQQRLPGRRRRGAVLAHVPGVREPAVLAAVAEARQLGGVRVAQHAAQGLGAADATVRVALEEAVDAEAGASAQGGARPKKAANLEMR